MWNINCFLNYHLLNHIATDVIWKQDNNLNPVVLTSDLQIFPVLGNDCGRSVQMLMTSTYPKPLTRASGTFMPRHMEDTGYYLAPLSRTVNAFPAELQKVLLPKPQCHQYISPALLIIHNIISLSGMHSSKILPLSTTALFQRPFFCTFCEMVVALGPREMAVIELHSNQRRDLIDFPTHSTLMVSSRHKILISPLHSEIPQPLSLCLWCYLCARPPGRAPLSQRWGTW